MPLFDLPLPSLESYRPAVHEPQFFDEFWSSTLAQAREHDGELMLADAGWDLAQVSIRDVIFPGFGGHPIRGWYVRPRGVQQALPCIVEVSGYGGGRGHALERTFWATAGYAHFFMDTRGQGHGWGNGGDTPDPVGSGASASGFMTRGIEDPSDYYYRRVFTDAVRAVDAARSLPGVDESAVFFSGASQGGGIALAVAGLAEGLAGVMADVPFLCHFERAVDITDEFPYGEIVKYLAVRRGDRTRVFETLSYFDGVNHAKRATAPLLASVALRDPVCPPSTGYAAFNWYGDRAAHTPAKHMQVWHDNTHEGGAVHQLAQQLQFVRSIAQQ
ncbi:acetylxylan esterase [Demequina sp. B12]|uniref:acetylxylan esterase n=1 Tax=Demequina sp. B12 TaxID=2992757 RepID=UPI00237BF3F8|nr:acetylxylan esterase [Demequina sp. B12]MDE0573785.1 acetylxylan esterase [Demequina sp. B12]